MLGVPWAQYKFKSPIHSFPSICSIIVPDTILNVGVINMNKL